MSADRPLCEHSHQMQIQRWLRRRLIVEGRPLEAEQFTLAGVHAQPPLQYRSYIVSHESKRATFFQPLKFHLEPPDQFIKFCLLRLLIPLLALAIAGEDAGPAFQQLPFSGPNQVGMNLVFTG